MDLVLELEEEFLLILGEDDIITFCFKSSTIRLGFANELTIVARNSLACLFQYNFEVL